MLDLDADKLRLRGKASSVVMARTGDQELEDHSNLVRSGLMWCSKCTSNTKCIHRTQICLTSDQTSKCHTHTYQLPALDCLHATRKRNIRGFFSMRTHMIPRIVGMHGRPVGPCSLLFVLRTFIHISSPQKIKCHLLLLYTP